MNLPAYAWAKQVSGCEAGSNKKRKIVQSQLNPKYQTAVSAVAKPTAKYSRLSRVANHAPVVTRVATFGATGARLSYDMQPPVGSGAVRYAAPY